MPVAVIGHAAAIGAQSSKAHLYAYAEGKDCRSPDLGMRRMKEPAQQHQSIPIDLRPGREAFPCCTELDIRCMDHQSSHALDSSQEVRDIHHRCSSLSPQHNHEQAKDAK